MVLLFWRLERYSPPYENHDGRRMVTLRYAADRQHLAKFLDIATHFGPR
jgi:hypothetical protein